MFSGLTELLSFGGGALGIVGIIYFIFRFFLDKKDNEEVVKDLQKETTESIKNKQKEIEELEKESKDLDKKADKVKEKISKTMKDLEKEKEKIKKSDSVEKTLNTIEEEW